jgi:hypothetical protein
MLGQVAGFAVGVDYGSVNTVAMLRSPDGSVRPLLFDGSPLLPSLCFVDPDGGIFVGKDAERRSRLDPLGQVVDPKGRLRGGEVTVRGRLVPVSSLLGAAFARVGQEAIRAAAGGVPRLVLAHPATWTEERRQALGDAAASAGLGLPSLVPAPLAIAWRRAASAGLPPGRLVLVCDVGGADVEVALVGRGNAGLEIVAARCLEDAGGLDLDRALVGVVEAQVMADAADEWWRLTVPATTAERRYQLNLWQQVREAKEALSEHPAVGLHIPLVDRELWVTREQFEQAAGPWLVRVVELALAVLVDAAATPADLAEVLLAGGSSQVPLLADLLHQELGLRPTPSHQPELSVAEGALAVIDGFEASSFTTLAARPAQGRPSAGPTALAGSMAADVAAGAEPTTTHLQVGEPESAEPPVDAGLDDARPTGGSERLAAAGPERRPPQMAALRRLRISGRASRIAAGVAVLVLLSVLAARSVNRPHENAAAPAPAQSARGAPPTAVTVDDGLASTSPSPAPSRTATSRSPAAEVPTPPPASTGPPPAVTMSVTAAPVAGSCTTDFAFTAHFTVSVAGRYRWHWVFGGPNGYANTSGDHDTDKSGDVRTSKKFNGQSGVYWAQVQVTSPISLSSAIAPVDVTCQP